MNNLEKYSIGSVIGKGSYAVVRMATHKEEGHKLAVKIYEKQRLKDPERYKNVVWEVKLLRKLDHPYIIKLVEVVDNYKSVNLVLEYAG